MESMGVNENKKIIYYQKEKKNLLQIYVYIYIYVYNRLIVYLSYIEQ